MLDIKRIKEAPEAVKAGLRAKEVNCDEAVDRILELDAQRRALIVETETKKAEQNRISKEIPRLKKAGQDVTPFFREMAELKTAIAEGKYIKAEEATRDLTDFMAMFKKFAMNIPPRAVKSIAGYADPQTARAMERAMRKELEDMLAVFVDAAEIGPEEAEP